MKYMKLKASQLIYNSLVECIMCNVHVVKKKVVFLTFKSFCHTTVKTQKQ